MCCHSVGARTHTLMLVLGVACAAIPGAQAAADLAASHAARVALAALAEVDASEAALLKEERQRIESGKLTPLKAGESLHDSLIPHLEAAVLALRHALAAGVVTEVADLAELDLLDIQFSAMVAAQTKEPLFFWHGPRRLALPRLRRVLGAARSQLEALAADRPDTPAELHQLLGEKAPLEPAATSAGQTPKVVLPHGVPSIGVAVGELACGKASACDIHSILSSSSGNMHLLVLPSSLPAMERIGAALRTSQAAAPWISFMPDVEKVLQLKSEVDRVLQALGKKSLDFLWVPIAGLKKVVWPKVKQELEALLQSNMIGAYGVYAEARNKKMVKQLFDREPAPVAWLTAHDFLKPIEHEALEAARELGLAIVAKPRRPPAWASDYLEAAAGTDHAAQQAIHYHWMMQRGLGFVADSGSASLDGSATDDALAVLRRLQDLKVSESALQVLDTAGAILRPYKVDDKPPLAESVPQGLQQRFEHWRRAAAQAAASTRGSAVVDNIAGSAPAGDFIPGVKPAVLETLEEQARRYKSNNHVIYTPDFFDEATFAAILEETKRLWKSDDIEGNCNLDGKHRLGGYVLDHTSHNSSLYKLIYGNEKFRRWVSAVNGEGPMWPSDFPIEIREYGPESKGMGCHPDLLMYAVAKKDLEFAVTVINDSKCKVTWYDANNVQHEVHTQGNSVMMVRANAATHCVSPTKGGSRTILKFIFVGDYRKSTAFSHYKLNECGPENLNNKKLRTRREAGIRSEL